MTALLTTVTISCRPAPSTASARTALRIATASEPRTLLPPLASDLVEGQIDDLLYARLADPTPGASPFDERGYRPGLARSWHWSADSLALTFVLDPNARWHDGAPLTSRDVQFTFDLLRDPRTGARHAASMRDVDSVTTPDRRTAVIWCHARPATLFHDLTYRTHVLPAHLLDSVARERLAQSAQARHPVGSGPFRFERWDAGQAIVLRADPGYRPPDGVTAPESQGSISASYHDAGVAPAYVVFRIYPVYEAALAALETGEADVVDYLRPADAIRLRRARDISVLTFPSYDYVYLLFNLRGDAPGPPPRPAADDAPSRGRPPNEASLFVDPRLRRALAMAIDRPALVANVLGPYGRVALGPITRALATADTNAGADAAAPGYSPDAARRALDTLGWRPGHDGVRVRRGQRLSFDLLTPTSSANRRRAAVILQAMLGAIGAEVRVEALDAGALSAALESGQFDTALGGLRVDPSPAQIEEVWAGPAGVLVDGVVRGFNFGGYADPEVDHDLDSAATTSSPAAALRFYRRAYRRIVTDVPAVFLYEPVAAVGIARRVTPAGVRPDAWWADLPAWRLSPGPPHDLPSR